MTVEGTEPTRGFSAERVEALRYRSRHVNRFENVALMMKRISNGAKILDIGCGTGSITGIIKERKNAEIIGVEPNEARANVARSEGIFVITGVYNETIATKWGPFDTVLFADVLEHVADPVELLDAVKSALCSGGIVVASIPNVAHWTVRVRLLFGIFDYQPTGIMDATHLRWFTRKGVRQLFAAAGYDVLTFDAAAGGWMKEYLYTPLRFIPQGARSAILSKFCAFLPGLFAVQHVVSARRNDTQD